MSINKTYLPKIEKVKEFYNEDPINFINKYKKCDVMIGEIDSVELVESKLKEYYEQRFVK